ncbi:thioredoxin-like protein [Ochromonadaceae sp. CCMP2298]|nr:thioredoxin-like protein [Ochromonadaceae sp. CCMP2298]
MDVGDEEGEEEDEDEGGDEDHALREIKEMRLKQMKLAHQEKLENIGKGHGQFRDIGQDEFITEVTTSLSTICMFYHRDFPHCEIMAHHLGKLAGRHVESKFIKIDSDKAPFFVEKLKIRTMPTVLIFKDGVAAEKIRGFEELADTMPEGQEDAWPTVVLARLLALKGGINSSAIVDDDEVEAAIKARLMELRR